ncbi:MAG: hypothetical protein J1F68_01640 [Clostridiales bacterium]|nr:hypothetical protein [Clostridiales bacterium]
MAKINRISVIKIVVAIVGVIIAIVGIFVPWFAAETEHPLYKGSMYGLFKQFRETDFPLEVLQSFALISLILSVATCVICILQPIGIIKIKQMFRIICAIIVLLFAVLTFIFDIVIAKQYGIMFSGLPSLCFVPSAGAYLRTLSGIIVSVPLLCGNR